MLSEEPDPLESVSKGITKGVIEWSEERIISAAIKFKNKDLAFIEDYKTISLVKEQRKTSEWDIFQQYVDDKDLRILFQLGLALRKMETEGNPGDAAFISLKERIFNKYKIKGLHIAQFIQDGIFNMYLSNILEHTKTTEDMKGEIHNLFKNIDITVSFIQIKDNEFLDKKINEIASRICGNAPKTYIILASRGAKTICDKIYRGVMRKIIGYTSETWNAGKNKRIYFITRIDKIE